MKHETVDVEDSHQNCLERVEAAKPETDVEILRSVPTGFCIDSAERANWFVRKVFEARKYAERVKMWAEQEQRRAAREEQTLMFLFGRQLEAWTSSELERLANKRKSVALPSGTVGFRTVRPKLIVDDEQAVLVWPRRSCRAAVVVVERVSKSVLDEHVATTGELPDAGAHVEAEAERFYIR